MAFERKVTSNGKVKHMMDGQEVDPQTFANKAPMELKGTLKTSDSSPSLGTSADQENFTKRMMKVREKQLNDEKAQKTIETLYERMEDQDYSSERLKDLPIDVRQRVQSGDLAKTMSEIRRIRSEQQGRAQATDDALTFVTQRYDIMVQRAEKQRQRAREDLKWTMTNIGPEAFSDYSPGQISRIERELNMPQGQLNNQISGLRSLKQEQEQIRQDKIRREQERFEQEQQLQQQQLEMSRNQFQQEQQLSRDKLEMSRNQFQQEQQLSQEQLDISRNQFQQEQQLSQQEIELSRDKFAHNKSIDERSLAQSSRRLDIKQEKANQEAFNTQRENRLDALTEQVEGYKMETVEETVGVDGGINSGGNNYGSSIKTRKGLRFKDKDGIPVPAYEFFIAKSYGDKKEAAQNMRDTLASSHSGDQNLANEISKELSNNGELTEEFQERYWWLFTKDKHDLGNYDPDNFSF